MKQYARKAGILSIISAIAGIVYMLSVIYWVIWIMWDILESGPEMVFMIIVFTILGLYSIILGAMAITGGVFAFKKKRFKLALAGSICAILVFFPVGIPAMIYTYKSKPEFPNQPKNLQ